MNTTTNTRRATGKANREHVLRLARNLPLTKSVLASRVETATPASWHSSPTCSGRRTKAANAPAGNASPDRRPSPSPRT